MFKTIVVVTLLIIAQAIAAPQPGFTHGEYALPAATSYASRIDVHSKPLVAATYAAPLVTKTVVTPLIGHGLHHTPLVSSYGYGLGHGYGGGLGHGYGAGLGYGSGFGYGIGHGYGSDHGIGLGYGLGHGYGVGHHAYGHGW